MSNELIVIDEPSEMAPQVHLYLTRPCVVCGKRSRVQVDPNRLARWAEGELIQQVWPEVSDEKRELLVSGTHLSCWPWLAREEE